MQEGSVPNGYTKGVLGDKTGEETSKPRAFTASELADLEKKESFYDAALRNDEGARDRARRAGGDDPYARA
jgi:hypothetical protein